LSSFGTVGLQQIWEMLDDCAPGYTRKARQHDWYIRWGAKAYFGFPLGPHGRRKNPGIQVGHVKQLVRQFDIRECAARHFPDLFG